MGLVLRAANQVGVLIGLEVRGSYDHRMWPECRGQCGNAFRETGDIELHRVGIAGHLLADLGLQFGGLFVKMEQGLGMHADHAIDDEFEPRQPDAIVRQHGKIEGAIGVADVHHDLDRNLGHGVEFRGAQFERQLTGIDHAGIAFRAGDRDRLAVFDRRRGIAASHHGGDAQFPGDDGGMTGASTAVGDDGGGPFHDRFPVRVGHVGHQYIAGPDTVHLGNVVDDAHRAGTDLLADGASLGQRGAGLFLEQVAFQGPMRDIALDGFRTGLKDVDLAVAAVLAPFDVHGPTVVLFDDQGLTPQFLDFQVGQAKALAIGFRDRHGLDALATLGGVGIDHLDQLGAQYAPQYGGTSGFQGDLVDIEFVGIDRALNHHLAQAIGGGDEHHAIEAGLGVQSKHDAGCADVAAHHALDAGGQRDQAVVKALVDAVGNGAVVVERREHFPDRVQDRFQAFHIQEGFLLSGEGGIRQVLGGGRRAYGDGNLAAGLRHHLAISGRDLVIEARGQGRLQDPAANFSAGLGQGIHVIHIERGQGGVNALLQSGFAQEIPIGLRRGGEAIRHMNACGAQVADHFTEGGILATHAVYIAHPKAIKPDDIAFQDQTPRG